ncbi:MAG: DUF2332 family protein [Clostridia bacterium]
MAVVHDLLLAGADHPLRHFYADLTPAPESPANMCPPAFGTSVYDTPQPSTCRLQTRLVQTNKVQGASYLYPVFGLIEQEMDLPLSVIDLGPSAGHLLLWDRFRYDYGTGPLVGPPEGRLTLRAEWRGEAPAPPRLRTRVAFRRGVDLNALNVRNPRDLRWLQAPNWPEAPDLRVFWTRPCVRVHSTADTRGRGWGGAPAVAAGGSPPGTVPVVFHLHVANQMPPTVRERLVRQIRARGRTRPVVHLDNKVHPERGLYLDVVSRTGATRRRLGLEDGHGRWFEWQACPPVPFWDT